jgi:hypothetical protein
MNRPLAYGMAGALLTGIAVWILRSHYEGDRLPPDPLDEVDRMMDQTRQKVASIQKNFDEFRQVLIEAKNLNSSFFSPG